MEIKPQCIIISNTHTHPAVHFNLHNIITDNFYYLIITVITVNNYINMHIHKRILQLEYILYNVCPSFQFHSEVRCSLGNTGRWWKSCV